MVQQSTASAGNTLQKQHHPTPQTSTSIKPPSACWNCGSWHFVWCTVPSRHTAAAAAIDWAIKKDSVPRMDKDQHRVDKPHITATNITKQIQTVWWQPFSQIQNQTENMWQYS